MPPNPERGGNGIPDSEWDIIMEWLAKDMTKTKLAAVWKKAEAKITQEGTPAQLEAATAYYELRKEEV